MYAPITMHIVPLISSARFRVIFKATFERIRGAMKSRIQRGGLSPSDAILVRPSLSVTVPVWTPR
jgi:hypothetical protein